VHVGTDAHYFIPDNFRKDARVRPSHRRRRGHRPTIRLFVCPLSSGLQPYLGLKCAPPHNRAGPPLCGRRPPPPPLGVHPPQGMRPLQCVRAPLPSMGVHALPPSEACMCPPGVRAPRPSVRATFSTVCASFSSVCHCAPLLHPCMPHSPAVCAPTSSVRAPLSSRMRPYFIHGHPSGSRMYPYGSRLSPSQSRALCSPCNIMEAYIQPSNVAAT
jgi:hypothetical protein